MVQGEGARRQIFSLRLQGLFANGGPLRRPGDRRMKEGDLRVKKDTCDLSTG